MIEYEVNCRECPARSLTENGAMCTNAKILEEHLMCCFNVSTGITGLELIHARNIHGCKQWCEHPEVAVKAVKV